VGRKREGEIKKNTRPALSLLLGGKERKGKKGTSMFLHSIFWAKVLGRENWGEEGHFATLI